MDPEPNPGKFVINTHTLLLAYVSLLLYVIDVVSDLFVAVRYGMEGKYVYCALTLSIVLISSIIVNYFWGYNTIEQLFDRGTVEYRIVYFVSMLFCATPVIQYCINVRILGSYLQTGDERKRKDLYWKFMCGNDLGLCQKLWEMLLEAMPQMSLQLYVIFTMWNRGETEKRLLVWQMTSIASSSLGVFTIAFSWFRANRLVRGFYVTIPGAALHSFARAIPIICHLTCTSASLSVHPFVTLGIVLLHWLLAAIWYYHALSKVLKKAIVWSTLITVTPYCFTVPQCALQNAALQTVDIATILLWTFQSKRAVALTLTIVLTGFIFRIVHILQIKYENRFLIKNHDGASDEKFEAIEYFRS